jgi:Tfp pilus assembly protein PilZ
MSGLTYREYLEHSERCMSMAEADSPSSDWLLIPATILAWCAMESFVNNIMDDFANLPEDMFALHERALLLERRLKFINEGGRIGQFVLEGREYRRLDDKIFFLLSKCNTPDLQNVKGKTIWQKFEAFKDVRDSLVHPRRGKDVCLTNKTVDEFIQTAKVIIQLISRNVWKQEVTF